MFRSMLAGTIALLGATSLLRAQVWTRDATFAPTLFNDVPALREAMFWPAADGRVLMTGSFTHVQNGAKLAAGLAYLKADGTLDAGFNATPGEGRIVRAVPLSDGRVIAQQSIDGSSRLIRLLRDGKADSSYTPVPVSYVQGVASLPDGRIAFWGDYIAVLGTDGVVDARFNATLPTDNFNVVAVAGQPDGKLLVSVRVRTATASPAGARLLRLLADGSVDASFAVYNTPTAFTTLAVQTDGRILAAAGASLVRFSAAGAVDPDFKPQIADLKAVERVTVRADAKMIVQAQVGTGSGPWPSTVLILSPSGVVQSDLRSTVGNDHTLRLASVQTDGTLFVVHGLPTGSYMMVYPSDVTPASFLATSTAGADTAIAPPMPPVVVPANPTLARISADGTTATDVNPGALFRSSGYVGMFMTDSAGRLILQGQFTQVNGTPSPGLVRFTAAGALDASFTPRLINATVSGILLIGRDGSMIVTESALGPRTADGLYEYVDTVRRLRPDGTTDPTFVVPAGAARSYGWHAVGNDGRVLVSYFAPDNSSEANLRLGWLASDGTIAATLSTRFAGLNSMISIPLEPGATLPMPGTTPGAGPSTPLPQPMYGNPFRFVRPLANGQLLVGGSFSRVDGIDRPRVARLNADGSLDSSYAPDLSRFIELPNPWLDGKDRVIVGGQVWRDGRRANAWLRLLPDGRPDPAYYSLPNYHGSALLFLDNGLPDLNFSRTLVQPGGTTVPVNSATTGPDGTAWTINPLARFTATDVPSITAPPADQTVVAGRDALFLVGLGSRHEAAYQWLFEDQGIPGATLPYLALDAVTPTQAGRYRVRVSIDGQTFTSAAGMLTVTGGAARIVNFSARAQVGREGSVIAGFSVAPDGAPRRWLIRAIGPTLTRFGVSGALPDPEVGLFREANEITHDRGSVLATPVTELAQTVGAFPPYVPFPWFPEWLTTESAVTPTLSAGNYTAHITSTSASTGVALVETYDSLRAGASGALRNVSLRCGTGVGANVATLGFVIAGDSPLHVLVRGVGPALRSFGVTRSIADPKITVSTSQLREPIVTNSGWSDDATIADAARRVGAFALATGSRDAAVLLRLEPGAYTVQLTSVTGASGEAMIEVYEVR